MSKDLIMGLLNLRDEHPEYTEELNLTIARIAPKKSGYHLKNVVNSYIDILCKSLEVDREYFLSKRSHDVLWLRHALIGWVKHNSTMSLTDIGKMFGNKDHSTIINSLKEINNALAENSRNQQLSDTYYKVKEALG
jgi:chromosomal replication initiator protein